jgi:hypothetical protein
MADAERYMENNKPVISGFRVSFEWYGDGFLRSDFFPENQEEPIRTEKEAWTLAKKFADAMKGKVCNLYVMDNRHVPVRNYNRLRIDNR